jgi:hypothetical protein
VRRDGATERRSDEGLGADEIIGQLRAHAPSLEVDSRTWDEQNEVFSSRFQFGVSGIDWSRTASLVESVVRSAESAGEFIRIAVGKLDLAPSEQVVVVADNLFDEMLSLDVQDLEACVQQLVGLPLGFLVGPVDGSWDWVIDVRFAGAAWAGRAPGVTR